MAAKKVVKAVGARTIEVESLSGSRFRVEIPKTFKITFGPWSVPTKDSKMRGYDDGIMRNKGTLRIYDGTSVVACWAGVTGFRDVALKCQVEKVRVVESSELEVAGNSSRKASTGETSAVWVDEETRF